MQIWQLVLLTSILGVIFIVRWDTREPLRAKIVACLVLIGFIACLKGFGVYAAHYERGYNVGYQWGTCDVIHSKQIDDANFRWCSAWQRR